MVRKTHYIKPRHWPIAFRLSSEPCRQYSRMKSSNSRPPSAYIVGKTQREKMGKETSKLTCENKIKQTLSIKYTTLNKLCDFAIPYMMEHGISTSICSKHMNGKYQNITQKEGSRTCMQFTNRKILGI